MPSKVNRFSWKSVLACCDSFKGTLTACDAGLAIERAFRTAEAGTDAHAEVVHCPMSDGGAGLLDSLFFPAHSRVSSPYRFARVDVPLVTATSAADAPRVVGPLGEPLNFNGGTYQPYFACDVEHRVVVIEMAVASGLPMVPEAKRNPLLTTSYGVGQVIRYAIEYVAREYRAKHGACADCGVTVFLGIGGSATNDGGLGALQALGVEMLVASKNGGSPQPLLTPFAGGDLQRLTGVRVTPECRKMFFRAPGDRATTPYCKEVRLIGDVASPLVGPHGATAVFGPQKCDSAWDKAFRTGVLAQLEKGMLGAATAVVRSRIHDSQMSEQQLKRHLEALCNTPGGGGAGGMSGFFRYVLHARWMAGADVVAELLGLPEKMRVCDCMITGEGSFDEQTIRYNKTLGRLLQLVVLENLRRRERGQAILGDVIVVCGRTSYRDAEEVRSVLIDHMRVQKEYKSDDASLIAAVPRVHLLPLTPRHFTVPEALGKAGACVEKRIMWYVSGTEGDAPHVATTPARKCSAKL